ncbi:MAG TPA: glycerol-3-phosphate 1-O-acyltransferase PlsY [Chthoniobacteraceae bacterium]|nr:glycerol-3-phosphate 1-O-acyltransferase PlsY [Chthoniobacteraceae bacterium]
MFVHFAMVPVLAVIVAAESLMGSTGSAVGYATMVVAGYLLGSIPTGWLVARAKGVDIRKQGSGNIGATNVFRTLGKGPGIFVFVCDALKGAGAVWVAMQILSHHSIVLSDEVSHEGGGVSEVIRFLPAAMAGIIGGIAAIIGHNFPVWLNFKGGKGVATSLGVVIGLAPQAAAVAFAVWVLVFFLSRYVSLASIIAAIAVPVTIALREHGGSRQTLLVFTSLAAFLIVVRHKENIKRLLNGTENRFGKKKKDSKK